MAASSISYDGGRTGDHYANIPVGEIYAIGVDMEDPYNVYAGLQDHEHWKGPSNGPLGRVTTWDWMAVGDNDGIFTQVDPNDSRWLYTTRQYGGHTRVDQLHGYEKNIWPQRAQGDPYRFQWITPLHISPHDSRVIYAGAQMLLRSPDRGDTWTEISPDLSTNDTTRILRESEGGVPGGIPWFAITSISESPVTKGVIWAGTSDGKVQVTRDDGGRWTDATAKITAAGGRVDAYVSRVRASSHVAGRAYVAKNGYRFDDFKPYLYRTDDFGATWRSISANLPNEPINVVWEDRKNPDLLFVGNDTGVFVSITGGTRWVKMNNNMPNVAVHDLLVHPRENDLILGIVRARPVDHERRRAAGPDAGGARVRCASVLNQADHAAHHVVVRRQRLPLRTTASLDAERAERDVDPLLPESAGHRWRDLDHRRCRRPGSGGTERHGRRRDQHRGLGHASGRPRRRAGRARRGWRRHSRRRQARGTGAARHVHGDAQGR